MDKNIEIHISTGGKQTWDYIETWLQDCLQNREWCSPRGWGHWRPTRLLDVESAEGIPSLRVVEGHAIPEGAQYATLSHCWGKAGVFFDRNPLIVKPCYLGTSWTGKIAKRLSCCYNNDWKYLLNNEPLNTRAWVLQERMLSQRICHFTRSQVIWECSESWACEGFPAERQATPTNRV
jgi:hypothetical protein